MLGAAGAGQVGDVPDRPDQVRAVVACDPRQLDQEGYAGRGRLMDGPLMEYPTGKGLEGLFGDSSSSEATARSTPGTSSSAW